MRNPPDIVFTVNSNGWRRRPGPGRPRHLSGSTAAEVERFTRGHNDTAMFVTKTALVAHSNHASAR